MAPRFLDHRCTGSFAYGISHTLNRVLESVYNLFEVWSGTQVSKNYRGKTTKNDTPTVEKTHKGGDDDEGGIVLRSSIKKDWVFIILPQQQSAYGVAPTPLDLS
jgi:hypothetical protein